MMDLGIISTPGLTTPAKGVAAVEKSALTSEKQRQDVPVGGKVLPPPADSEAQTVETLKAVETISEFTQHMSRNLEFKVDVDSGTAVVTVRDRETEEVIRQFPSEEVVAMARFIAEQSPESVTGLLVDQEG